MVRSVSVVTSIAATRPWTPSTHLTGDLAQTRSLLAGLESVVVLSGAGVSTDSGVPDYRGPAAQRATPMMFSEFCSDPAARQRYWARNFRGWAAMSRATPNLGHRLLARWEVFGVPCPLVGLITQNVDGLHEQAGSRRMVNLHGRGDEVICLGCGQLFARSALQVRMAELNPTTDRGGAIEHAELRPDGDAVVEDWSDFVVPDCPRCGGVLKPHVVFFGEPVPAHRATTAFAWCEAAAGMIVVGSSLTVMSGLRFVRRMARAGKPVVIINQGATRADELATIRLDLGVSQALTKLVP